MQYVDEPVGRVKIQTTSKNIQRYYTPKRVIKDVYYPTISFPKILTCQGFKLHAAGRNEASYVYSREAALDSKVGLFVMLQTQDTGDEKCMSRTFQNCGSSIS